MFNSCYSVVSQWNAKIRSNIMDCYRVVIIYVFSNV